MFFLGVLFATIFIIPFALASMRFAYRQGLLDELKSQTGQMKWLASHMEKFKHDDPEEAATHIITHILEDMQGRLEKHKKELKKS